MSRHRFNDMDCSVARTLDLVGDWWTLLIVREAMFGTRRFSDFARNLGIAKNILSARLKELVESGVLERVATGESEARPEYRLTERGRDLSNVLNALREWGDKWVYGPGNEPLVMTDRETGRPVSGLAMLDADGNPLPRRAVKIGPGKNAPASVKQRFAATRG
jgi:DNA-binding HxlR family transcriptional regulator